MYRVDVWLRTFRYAAQGKVTGKSRNAARRKILAALEKFEANRIAELDQGAHVTSSSKMNPLEFRAKYIRSTTPADEGGSTRIAKHAVPLLHPPAYKSSLPSITGTTDLTSTSVPLFSPRSFDRPARTPFIAPPTRSRPASPLPSSRPP